MAPALVTGAVALPEGVFVDGATAYELTQALNIVASYARSAGVPLSPRLVEARRCLAAVGEPWAERARLTFRDRYVGIPAGGDPAKVAGVKSIGSREAGHLMGISPRAVVARANRGTLAGRLVDGRWRFPLTVVVDAAQAREESHVA